MVPPGGTGLSPSWRPPDGQLSPACARGPHRGQPCGRGRWRPDRGLVSRACSLSSFSKTSMFSPSALRLLFLKKKNTNQNQNARRGFGGTRARLPSDTWTAQRNVTSEQPRASLAPASCEGPSTALPEAPRGHGGAGALPGCCLCLQHGPRPPRSSCSAGGSQTPRSAADPGGPLLSHRLDHSSVALLWVPSPSHICDECPVSSRWTKVLMAWVPAR